MKILKKPYCAEIRKRGEFLGFSIIQLVTSLNLGKKSHNAKNLVKKLKREHRLMQ